MIRIQLTIIVLAIFFVPVTHSSAQQHLKNDRRFNAVAYVQNAFEYQMLARQAYRLALVQLKKGLADKKWSADEVQLKKGDFSDKPAAIILDVDETVLDNSAFNARNIVNQKNFSRNSWNQWCKEVKATAIPGVVEFVKQAEKLDVKIFYVTNRDDELKEATIKNINKIGLKADKDNVLTRNEEKGRGDDKLTRRAMVAKEHRVVLLIGDSMSDLCSGMGTKDQKQRNSTANQKSKMLGERWIMLPNAAYGSWERALPKGKKALKLEQTE